MKQTRMYVYFNIIFIQVNKEIGKLKIDEGTLEHLFETRATELKPKVRTVTIATVVRRCPDTKKHNAQSRSFLNSANNFAFVYAQ